IRALHVTGVQTCALPISWSCVDQACDADEEAMLNAFAAGVLSVVAAGNEGPGTSTVTTPGNAPWVLTVANATHDRAIVNRLVERSEERRVGKEARLRGRG